MAPYTTLTPLPAYRLIDTDTRAIVGTGTTEAAALEHCCYMPYDCVDGATTWQEVVDSAASHVDGIAGLVDGFTVEALATTNN